LVGAEVDGDGFAVEVRLEEDVGFQVGLVEFYVLFVVLDY